MLELFWGRAVKWIETIFQKCRKKLWVITVLLIRGAVGARLPNDSAPQIFGSQQRGFRARED